MAGYSPAGRFPMKMTYRQSLSYTFSHFLSFLHWLEYEASDETYWTWWRKINGWPVPRRSQDSWLDRLKHRDTFLGRVAVALFGN